MFGAPLLSLDDLMDFHADQAGLEFDFVQLAAGHLEHGQADVTIGDVTISSESVGKPLRVCLRAPPDVVSISFMPAPTGRPAGSGMRSTNHTLWCSAKWKMTASFPPACAL